MTTQSSTIDESIVPEDRPDAKDVEYSGMNTDNSEIRRKQLDNIAETAREFQPRGYTLETTEVSEFEIKDLLLILS